MIKSTIPYVLLSFLFLDILILEAQISPSLLHSSLGDPFCQGVPIQGDRQLTTILPLAVCNLWQS
jgi:hypothetical protein